MTDKKLGFESALVLHKIGHELLDSLPVSSLDEIPPEIEQQAEKIPDIHGEPRIQVKFRTGVEHLKDEPLI